MLHDTRAIKPEDVDNRRWLRSTKCVQAVVNVAGIVVEVVVDDSHVDPFRRDESREEVDRALPAGKDVRVMLNIVLRHMIQEGLCGVLFHVEVVDEVVKDGPLLRRTSWAGRTVGQGCSCGVIAAKFGGTSKSNDARDDRNETHDGLLR